MEYREALTQQVEKYYREIIEVYKNTTMEAMQDARKLGLFKKRSFRDHIANFQKHKEDAESLDISGIEIASYDVKAKLLADAFQRSVRSFIRLCEENMTFYDITEKKQYRGSGIKVKDYTESFNHLQQILQDAVVDLDALDNTYQQYNADKLTD